MPKGVLFFLICLVALIGVIFLTAPQGQMTGGELERKFKDLLVILIPAGVVLGLILVSAIRQRSKRR